MKKSGIYKITNTISKNIYIGSSVDIKNRWRQHRYYLMRNKHQSVHLQNAWNKYGVTCFIWEIIEECPLDKTFLLEREQYYIDTMKPQYNLCQKAGSTLGVKHSEEAKRKMRKPKSEEHKAKIREIVKSRSEDVKKKISETLKGRKNGPMSDEQKEKLRKPKSEEAKQKMRKPKSEEHKKKISDARKGIVLSEETKAKISEAKKGKKKT